MSFQNPGTIKISWTFFPAIKKTQSKKFFDSVFVKPFLPHVWDFLFHFLFQTTKNIKFSLYPFLTFFSTMLLETHLGELKAACIGPALSKFSLSVGDGASSTLQDVLPCPEILQWTLPVLLSISVLGRTPQSMYVY